MTENGKRVQVKFSQDPNRGCAHVKLTENTSLTSSVRHNQANEKRFLLRDKVSVTMGNCNSGKIFRKKNQC